MKTKVSDGPRYTPFFDKEGPIASHAGEGQIGGIDWSNIPKVRDENSAPGFSNKFIDISTSRGTLSC